jgi:RHS repeat-associated protein
MRLHGKLSAALLCATIGLAWNTFVTAAELPAPSLAATCTSPLPPGEVNGNLAIPGNFRNPKRFGTGWTLQPATGNRLLVTWHTFDPGTGRPVFLQGQDNIAWTYEGDNRVWRGNLHEIEYDYSNFTRTETAVGSVSITFPLGSASRAAIRWQWNAVDNAYHDECVYNYFREPNNPAANPTEINGTTHAAYTARWSDQQTPGWGINVEAGEDLVGNHAEISTVLIYDDQGKGAWLIASMISSQWPSTNWKTTPIFHTKGNYDIRNECTDPATCRVVTQMPSPSFYGRAYDSPIIGTARVEASGTVAGQTFAWPPNWSPATPVPPGCPAGQQCRRIRRLTDGMIVTSKTYCPIAVGATTCKYVVSWATTVNGATVKRFVGSSNTGTIVASGADGEIEETMGVGTYRYAVYSGNSELYRTPSVLVEAQTGPLPEPTPQLPSVPSVSEPANAVGFTPGEFRVDEGGAATYRVPLFAPKGRGNLTPQFALNYSSSAAEGNAGWGWNLSGTSVISRCRLTDETDGRTMQMTNHALTHSYCLDGQRLIQVANERAAGHTGAEYRTEIDTFQKIVVIGHRVIQTPTVIPGESTTSAEPTRFLVYGKDGVVRQFGAGTGIRRSSTIWQNDFTVEWWEAVRADRSGNAITFTYAGNSSDGSLYLSSASYNGGLIEFDYIDRPQPLKMFSHGALVTYGKLLKSVRATVAGIELRKYTLTYDDPTTNPNVKRIAGLTECVGGSCFAPTAFQWNKDLPIQDVGKPLSTNLSSGDLPGMRNFKLGDIDGDGRPDLVYVHKDQKRLYLSFNRAGATTGRPTFGTPSDVGPVYGTDAQLSRTWALLDFNADGRQDLIFFNNETNVEKWQVRLSDGSGFGAAQSIDGPGYWFDDVPEAIIADFNGDGLPDIFARYTRNNVSFPIAWLMQKVDGGGAAPYKFVQTDVTLGTNGVPGGSFFDFDPMRSDAVDIDGDGRSDLVLRVSRAAQTPIEPEPSLSSASGFQGIGAEPSILGAGEISPMDEWEDVQSSASGTSGDIALYRLHESSNGILRFERMYAPALDADDIKHNSVRVSDINGDGYADVVWNVKNTQIWKYVLGKGITFETTAQCITPNCANLTGGDYAAQIADYDGDGRLDFWGKARTARSSAQCHDTPGCPDVEVYKVYLWEGSQFSQTPVFTDYQAGGEDWTTSLIDLDGDGYPESFRIKQQDGGWYVTGTTDHHKSRSTIEYFSQGLGGRTEISYVPSTFNSIYGRRYDAASIVSGRGTPVQDVLLPRFLVSSVESDAPVPSNLANRARIQYRYEGYRMQGGGRGSLGFQRIFTLADGADATTKLETITEYHQAFPLTGLPKSTTVRVSSGWSSPCTPTDPGTSACLAYPSWPEPAQPVPLTRNDDTWTWRVDGSSSVNPPLSSVAGPASITVQQSESRTIKRDLNGGLLSSEKVEFGFGSHGNLDSSTTTNYSDVWMLNPIRRVKTQNFYTDNVPLWLLGRMTSSVVTTSRPNANGVLPWPEVSRTTEFSYDEQTGLLRMERIEPYGDAKKKLSTFYTYDAYGNQTEKRTCSGDVSDADCKALNSSNIRFKPASPTTVRRYSRVEYDSAGIFPKATYSPYLNNSAPLEGSAVELAAVTSVLNRYGNPTHTTNVNGAVAVAGYDAFGRKYFDGASDGSWTQVTRQWCTPANCPTGVGIGAAYVVTSTQPTGAQTWTYFDRLDREVLGVTKAFTGATAGTVRYVAVRKTYDTQGRPERVSEPYYSQAPGSTAGTPTGGVAQWTTTVYDALGRVKETQHPNGTKTTVTYNGRVVTTTLPANKNGHQETKTQVTSLLGEVESVQDGLGSFVEFTYDLLGNPVKTSRLTHDGQLVESTATYDVLGRRTQMTDGDTGTWNTDYNAAGEVIRTWSASTCVESYYDALGRLWKRNDYANSTCSGGAHSSSAWTFDTGANGRGSLDFVTTMDGDLNYQRVARYDAIGRTNRTETRIGTNDYVERATFDAYGRPMQSFFSGTGIPEQGELVQYDTHGYSFRVRDAMGGAAGRVFHEVIQRNARGQATEERRANAAELTTTRTFEASTGRLLTINTAGNIQQIEYQYDALGNLDYRKDRSGGNFIHEVYSYDKLQRLLKTQYLNAQGGELTPASPVVQTYDGLGNRKVPGNVIYGTKAANCSASDATPGSGALSVMGYSQYCYDSRGNRVRRLDNAYEVETISYTPYEQVREVRSKVIDAHTTKYYYGPERQRIRRIDWKKYDNTPGPHDVADTIGSAEILTPAGAAHREIRRHLGAVIRYQSVTNGIVGASNERYVLTDAQGSPHRITNAIGESDAEGQQWFAAFGKRANSSNGTPKSVAEIYLTTTAHGKRGYTGHEHADAVGLIHMNGRMYDPMAGRFIQADPMVQDPMNLQNLNRYTYVLNNPFAYTDPSGYWGKKEQGYLRTAAAIGIAVYTGYYIGTTTLTTGQAVALAASGGAASGAVATGTLRGAVIGAFSGAVAYGIGSHFQGLEGSFGHVVSHATLGGVTSYLNGGKFGHGFVSAGVSTALSPYMNTGDTFGDAVSHAVVGGTVSAMSGGKFANGAVTSAFSYGLNELTHSDIERATETHGTYESVKGESFQDFSDRLGTIMLQHTEKTGYEFVAGFGKRVVGSGAESWTQYAAIVQTQGSHIFSAVVYMPSGYEHMMSSSGYVLRIHTHGLSRDAKDDYIPMNEMDKKYKAIPGSSRINPNVPNQRRNVFSDDDSKTRGFLATPNKGVIMHRMEKMP